MKVWASYYRQFDADYARDVPAEGYGGWQRAEVELPPERTALVVMHAWDCGTREEFPGWYRCVEYIPRAQAICREVFPRLLGAVRGSRMRLFHVVGCGPAEYKERCAGFRRAKALAGAEAPPLEQVTPDATLERLRRLKQDDGYVGKHNLEDVGRGFKRLDFAPEARPRDDEGVAETRSQLFALCKEAGVNHLIYVGFAINWCLMFSGGGMADMSRHGIMCSAIRQGVTAVENRESARGEWGKELALWRVGLAYGFVFDLDDFLAALPRK